jgi:HEAT repeat protein
MKKAVKPGVLLTFVSVILLFVFIVFVPFGNALFFEFVMWSRNEKLRPWALRNLQNLKLRGLNGLRQALTHEDFETRSVAADGIGQLGPDGAPAVNDLIKLLIDKEVEVRRRVVWALGNIGTEESLRGLTKAIEDENEFIRQYVCQALFDAGPRAAFAVDKLALRLEKDDNWEVRELSAKTLGMLGKAASAAIPTLEKTAKDDDEDVAAASSAALKKIRSFRD